MRVALILSLVDLLLILHVLKTGRFTPWFYVITFLPALKARWPDYRSPEGHLLYARSLEMAGRDGEALETYEAVEGISPARSRASARPGFCENSAAKPKRGRSPRMS